MTTMWEMRSTNPIVGWPGVAASAQVAWNPEAVAAGQLPRRVAANLYGPEAAADVVHAWRRLGGDRFYDRYRREADKPEMPGRRTYHVDFHEFVASDPMVFLTYEGATWAEGVVAEAARGIAAAEAAAAKARWGGEGLQVAQLAGLQQAYHGQRRAAVNAAGRAVVAAERQRRQGDSRAAATTLDEAITELGQLADLVAALVPASRDLWHRTRRMDDPAIEDLYLRRLKTDLASLRRHVSRLQRARGRLARGVNVDLSRIIGGQPVLVIEAHNPSARLIDILQAEIAASTDGRRWRTICDKGWFMLSGQTYVVPLIVGAALPGKVRLHVKRTHINPRRFPLADRLRLSTARTLTPGEIIDEPPRADIVTTDWRLVRTWSRGYGLSRTDRWRLEYVLTHEDA
jgi:hypothetical protein